MAKFVTPWVLAVGAALSVLGPSTWAQDGCGGGWSPIPGRPGPVGAFNTDPSLNGVTAGPIFALRVFDQDGPGPMEPYLVAAGAFISMGVEDSARLARWNGVYWESWTTSQVANPVCVLVEWDTDGAGPDLPQLHAIDTAGVLYRWNGTQWSGLTGPVPIVCGDTAPIRSAAAYDDNNDGVPSLFVAVCDRVYKRVGGAWQLVGNPFLGAVHALEVHDDGLGLGPRLYAGGEFAVSTGGPANRVAVLQHLAAPQQWFSLPGQGLNGAVYALRSGPDFEAPGERSLYVGGSFTSIVQQGAARLIAEWDGAFWSPVGVGLKGGDSSVRVITTFDPDGAGPSPEALAVGGGFGQTNEVNALNVRRVALWNGAAWSALGGGLQAGALEGENLGQTSPTVRALAVFDDDQGGPGGARLYAAGYFGDAGGLAVNSIAPWAAPAPLVVTSDPVDLSVTTGQRAVFAISVSSTGETPAFRWLRNGQPILDDPRTPGAHGPTLAIENVTADDAGLYSCEVSAPGCLTAVSAPAFLTVACAGDANLDGAVDFSDLNTVVSFFNSVCP